MSIQHLNIREFRANQQSCNMSISSKPVQLAFNVFEPVQGVFNDSPIIFLHGITASKETWNDIPQIAANATNRKAYSLDCRNHGDSEWSDEFDFNLNVVDLLHFIDQINAHKVILVGHSMGGITAMKAALQNPSRIEKIIIEDMTVRKLPSEILELIKLFLSSAQVALQTIPLGTSIETAKSYIADFIFNCLPDEIKSSVCREKEDPRILLKQNADGSLGFKTNLKALAEYLSNHEFSHLEPITVYEQPACFIYGKKSLFSVGLDEGLIQRYFPTAQMVGVEDAFHNVHLDCPLAFIEAMLRFLQE